MKTSKSKGRIMGALFLTMAMLSCTEEKFMNEPGSLVPKTVDEDSSLPSITVNGAMLHAEAFGDPSHPMVVVLHGGPGEDYRSLLNAKDLVSHGYRVVFYDQRGSGLSQRFPEQSYTSLGVGAIDQIYDDLAGVIAHYRSSADQKVFLLAHSWGGILATGYVGKYPNAIQGLIVAEAGGLEWSDIIEYIGNVNDFDPFGETLNDAAYMDQFITGKENEHEILDYKRALLASKNENTGDTESFLTWRKGAVVNMAFGKIGEKYHPDFSAGIENFNVPVLFLYSEKNKAYPTSWAQRISGAYNEAELFQIMGCGHEGIVANTASWRNHTLPKALAYFNSL